MRKVKLRSRLTPKYQPNHWKKFRSAGCYAYALDLQENQFLLVGDLIGKRCDSHVSNEYLIETLKEELKIIFGYEVKEVNVEYRAKNDEKKIFLERHEHTGFYHFFREDDDGTWSDKFPNELPVKVFSMEKVLEDIKKPDFSGWCFLLK